jgi:hypothetical protein
LDDAGTASATNTRAATATSEPTGSPTVDPSATVTEDPDGTQTPSGDANQGSDGSGSNPATATRPPAATATPVPTATPASSALAYCETSGEGTLPSGSVIGLVTIGGLTAPPGTIVTLAFDGVPGPFEAVFIEDNKAGYSFNYPSGGIDCANQVGAEISVIVNGQSFPTGAAIGDGNLLVLFNVDAN